MSTVAAVQQKAIELGKLSLRMTAMSGSGHPSSALSLAHIVAHLMYERMRFTPADPFNLSADRLVLSEGHAVPVVYAAYADLGGAVGKNGELRPLRVEEVDELRARDSVLDGHPNPAEGVPFFDAATGSLGQGLSVAAGLALAARRDGTDRKIYCLIGDGEAREGQIWEAADFVADHKLTNVFAVINCNAHGQAGPVSAQQSDQRLAAKFAAFGWDVVEIDGHDPAQIAQAFDKPIAADKPRAIIARTVKGWGVDALLDGGNWHGKPLGEAELAAANASLDKRLEQIGGAADGAKLDQPPAPSASPKVNRVDPASVKWPAFAEAMQAAGFGGALEKGKLSTRRAYGAALRAAGDLAPQVVALDGDVSNSTFANIFAAAFPERFFECKIAEQNMISVGAGLSAAGFIPFANSFAKFIARAYDQVEMANISRANLKIVGSHSGISLAADGPSQMSLVDVAFFRSFASVPGDDGVSPQCWVFHPADAVAAYHCTRLMTELRGMCYMRTHRPDEALLYQPDATFEPGGLFTHGDGKDLTIATAGYMVHVALQAAKMLQERGVGVTVVDLYSFPLNEQRVTEILTKIGAPVLAVEDNYGGGVGSALAEVAAAGGAFRVHGLHCQRMPKSTRSAEDELDYCGVGVEQICALAQGLVG